MSRWPERDQGTRREAMKKTRSTIVNLSIVVLFAFVVPPAVALTSTAATIRQGAVEGVGENATPNADISWEGQLVTQAVPHQLSKKLLIGVWETQSYNNGFNGEIGHITFFEDNTFEIEGTLSIIPGCSLFSCTASTGTYQVLD
jgi:hypothetical protein